MVIGGGLAGCEAAWQIARSGARVTLVEMRPAVMTPAHRTGHLAELVCSNSLRATSTTRAPGLLKAEMRLLGSIVLEAAFAAAIPAGSALGVDRNEFALGVEERLLGTGRVRIVREEARDLPSDRVTVLATGPMTSPAMLDVLRRIAPFGTLRFYDAVSPIVSADSIDREVVFEASRYDKGEPGYLNCPFTRQEYEAFYEALRQAEVAPTRQYPGAALFEGCLPVEELARRGVDALRFGPMKPVGLTDPRTGSRPWAVCQLRQENRGGTMYNLVGFQTGLKWSAQAAVFRMIPGLERAEFLRYGVMHANTYLDAPRILDASMRLRDRPNVFVAGQLAGVEGYVESAMCGLYCGMNAARALAGQEPVSLPPESLAGSLISYITSPETGDLQPMNANFGLLPDPDDAPRNKAERREVMVQRALAAIERFSREHQYGLAD